MNKLYILIVSVALIAVTTLAENSDDHSGHDHKNVTQKSEHKGLDDHSEHDLGKKDDHKEHDDHDDHGGGKAVGKGKAIEAVDELKGFKLSKEAIKTLKLKLQNVDGDEFEIDKSTLVASKGIKGLYRFREGFFKFLEVKIKKEIKGKYLVKVKGVDFGDQVVINGVGLLRVTDVYSTDKSEYGHAH